MPALTQLDGILSHPSAVAFCVLQVYYPYVIVTFFAATASQYVYCSKLFKTPLLNSNHTSRTILVPSHRRELYSLERFELVSYPLLLLPESLLPQSSSTFL